jgi:GR25 family glycosyltransferase involved in LPS biosynthesis
MSEEFKKWNLDNKNVKWILEPNKDNIDENFRKQIVIQHESTCCGINFSPGCPHIGNGTVSCTYKHYLCLKDIVENNYDYGVIMEDNQFFCGDIQHHVNLYITQLNELYTDNWDIIFDTKWLSYKNIEEETVKDGIFVYPKSNEIGKYVHGGTRLAQFYIINNKCAKKLFENYIPFNNAPDWWMNDLFRKLNIKSFWSEPSISDVFPHISTAN